MVVAALSGANMVYGAGMSESGMTLDFSLLVADNEMAEMVKCLLRGIPINDWELDLDEFEEEGIGGNWITADKTLEYARNVYSKPKFIDRTNVETWEAAGCPAMIDRCDAEAKRVLETVPHDPLKPEVSEYIRELVVKYERDLGFETPKEIAICKDFQTPPE